MKLYVLPSYFAVQTAKYVKIHDSDGLYVPYFRFWTLLEIRFSVVWTWGFWPNVVNKIEIMRTIHMLIVNLVSTTLTKENHPLPRHLVCLLHFHIWHMRMLTGCLSIRSFTAFIMVPSWAPFAEAIIISEPVNMKRHLILVLKLISRPDHEGLAVD